MPVIPFKVTGISDAMNDIPTLLLEVTNTGNTMKNVPGENCDSLKRILYILLTSQISRKILQELNMRPYTGSWTAS
jgi:hypothetical protein